MYRSLSGKVAVITGASSGIGLATARALADAGAQLVISARSTKKLERAAQDFGDVATVVTADVTSTHDVQFVMDAAVERHGRIDILLANAGVYAGGTSLLVI